MTARRGCFGESCGCCFTSGMEDSAGLRRLVLLFGIQVCCKTLEGLPLQTTLAQSLALCSHRDGVFYNGRRYRSCEQLWNRVVQPMQSLTTVRSHREIVPPYIPVAIAPSRGQRRHHPRSLWRNPPMLGGAEPGQSSFLIQMIQISAACRIRSAIDRLMLEFSRVPVLLRKSVLWLLLGMERPVDGFSERTWCDPLWLRFSMSGITALTVRGLTTGYGRCLLTRQWT
mmetsp:Transcript_12603/g.34725  ORF Transcript_12603/g.34725 Transcript_12603/m.34725 type:complete len:227 (-) Transcript_12603:2334-3014(-)